MKKEVLTGNATIFAPFDTASFIFSLARNKFWALFEETASWMSAMRNAENNTYFRIKNSEVSRL